MNKSHFQTSFISETKVVNFACHRINALFGPVKLIAINNPTEWSDNIVNYSWKIIN